MNPRGTPRSNALTDAIDAVIRLLPSAGDAWPLVERVMWLDTMSALLRLAYDPTGPRLSVELVGDKIIITRPSSSPSSPEAAP